MSATLCQILAGTFYEPSANKINNFYLNPNFFPNFYIKKCVLTNHCKGSKKSRIKFLKTKIGYLNNNNNKISLQSSVDYNEGLKK